MYSMYPIPPDYYSDCYDIPYCAEEECKECEKKDKRVLVASDHLYALINILYSNKDLQMSNLRETLDELCHCLDIDMPFGNPNITRA